MIIPMNRERLQKLISEEQKEKHSYRVYSKVSPSNASKSVQKQTIWESFTIEQLNQVFSTAKLTDADRIVFIMTQIFGIPRLHLGKVLQEMGKTHTAISKREKSAFKKLQAYYQEITETITLNNSQPIANDHSEKQIKWSLRKEIKEEFIFEQQEDYQEDDYDYGENQDDFSFYK
jgi:hypothetical protein